MPSEIRNTPNERLADLEARLARNERQRGRSRPPQLATALHVMIARTLGDPYPEQVDGKGARLPIVFLDVVYDPEAEDTVDLVQRSATPQAMLHSPFGWIPEKVDMEVHWNGRFWCVVNVPLIEVVIDEPYDIEADDSGYVLQPTTEKQFVAWFDLMAGSNAAIYQQEALAWLNPNRKKWQIINKEC